VVHMDIVLRHHTSRCSIGIVSGVTRQHFIGVRYLSVGSGLSCALVERTSPARTMALVENFIVGAKAVRRAGKGSPPRRDVRPPWALSRKVRAVLLHALSLVVLNCANQTTYYRAGLR